MKHATDTINIALPVNLINHLHRTLFVAYCNLKEYASVLDTYTQSEHSTGLWDNLASDCLNNAEEIDSFNTLFDDAVFEALINEDRDIITYEKRTA